MSPLLCTPPRGLSGAQHFFIGDVPGSADNGARGSSGAADAEYVNNDLDSFGVIPPFPILAVDPDWSEEMCIYPNALDRGGYRAAGNVPAFLRPYLKDNTKPGKRSEPPRPAELPRPPESAVDSAGEEEHAGDPDQRSDLSCSDLEDLRQETALLAVEAARRVAKLELLVDSSRRKLHDLASRDEPYEVKDMQYWEASIVELETQRAAAEQELLALAVLSQG